MKFQILGRVKMRKYLVKGYIIVQGQKIQIIEKVLVKEYQYHAVNDVRDYLSSAFSEQGDIVVFDNCVFEKDACAGVFAEAEDIGHYYKWYQRLLRKIFSIRLTWK